MTTKIPTAGLSTDVLTAIRALQREAAQAAIEFATMEPCVLPRDYATALLEQKHEIAAAVADAGDDGEFVEDCPEIIVLLRTLSNIALLMERNTTIRTALDDVYQVVRDMKVALLEVGQRRQPGCETVPFGIDDFERFHSLAATASLLISEVVS